MVRSAMKKIVLVLGIFLTLSLNVKAEVYRGIDISRVYTSSDWSSKDKIKDIINDYSLLLQYQKELSLCSKEPEKLICMNSLTEDIIKNFYNHNLEQNLNNYHNYVKATASAYGVIYCLNKYRFPSGTMCNQETQVKIQETIEQYAKDLLQSVKQIFLGYSFLQDYKD